MDPFTIPAHFRQVLLPSPTCSVAEILEFRFPQQVRSNTPKNHQYWSSNMPVMVDTERLKSLSIPGRTSLQQIKNQIYHHHSLGEAASIQYSHLPHTPHSEVFPLWVITFWIEVSLLRQYVKEPWERAELWLTKKWSTFRNPEKRRLCEEAQSALRNLPWAGKIFGFTEDEPVTRLAEYLSDAWLTTVHVNQQLDLLRWDLLRSGMDPKCEVVNLAFFVKVLDAYRSRKTIPYNAERKDARHIWAIGEELGKDVRSRICGVVNVEDSHWVAVAIEVLDLVVRYGDALKGSNPEVSDALVWWIGQHVKEEYRKEDLPITRQLDTHSCSVLALNATGHFCLPSKISLLDPGDAAYERIACFVRTAKRDLDNRPVDTHVPFGSISTFEIVPAGSAGYSFVPTLASIEEDEGPAWAMCKAGEFNLSFDSLTSGKADQALRELPISDPEFFAELIQPRPSRQLPPKLTSDEEKAEDTEEDSVNVFGDDSEVPLDEVMKVQGRPIVDDDQSLDADDLDYVPGKEIGGGLVSTADAETTFVECIEGRTVDVTPEGRGLRKKRKNVLYSSTWWTDNSNYDSDS